MLRRWTLVVGSVSVAGVQVAGVLVAGVLVAGAVVAGTRLDRGLDRSGIRVDDLPVDVVTPAGAAAQRRPAVVVAHGFAGSGRVMRPFADTLVRRGYVVALVDLTGHGANTRPLRSFDLLQDDLAAVLRHVRARPDVDPTRIALLGHSMGAAAVVRHAAADQAIAATVAISLGDAEVAALRPGPRNLLLLVGGWEFAGFRDATRIGAQGSGDTRRAVVVPFVEHIGVLFADRAHAEAADWLDAALAHRSSGAVAAKQRFGAAALWLLGMLVLGYPLLVWLRAGRRAAAGVRLGAPVRALPWPWLAGGLAGGIALGIPAGWLVDAALPVAVGGYTAGFFAVVGCALLTAARAARRAPTASAPTPPRWALACWALARWALAAVLFGGYGVAAIVVPMHLGLTSMTPHGPRWWLLPVVALATAVLLGGVQAATGGAPLLVTAVLAVVAVVLVAAAFASLAPGFVTLVAPLLVGLFAAHVGFVALARRVGAPLWFPLPAGALAVAWPIATTVPLTG